FHGFIVQTVLGDSYIAIVGVWGLLGTQLSVDCIFVVLISDQSVARGYVIDGMIRPAMGLWHTGGGKPSAVAMTWCPSPIPSIGTLASSRSLASCTWALASAGLPGPEENTT